jgi:hypothetical protein
MRGQLRRDDAGPEAIGLQSPPQRFIEYLLVGQVPEFVTQHGIVLLVADKDEFQWNRLGRGPRAIGRHGRSRLVCRVGPQSSTTPACGKQGETDGGGVPYRAVEHDAGDRKGGWRGGEGRETSPVRQRRVGMAFPCGLE